MQTVIFIEDGPPASCDETSTELAQLRFRVEKPRRGAAADRS